MTREDIPQHDTKAAEYALVARGRAALAGYAFGGQAHYPFDRGQPHSGVNHLGYVVQHPVGAVKREVHDGFVKMCAVHILVERS